MPNEVLNTKHPGTESIEAIREWSKAKFASKQEGGITSFIIRLSFSPVFIGQTWVLAGGTERYTGTVKETADDVKVIGINNDSEPIQYTLTTTYNGEEVVRIFTLEKSGNYYPFGLYGRHVTLIPLYPWSSGTDEQITAMINALDSGLLTIEETGWQVGDTRTVTIDAMENTDGEGNTIVGETHAEQQITRVLGHIGSSSGISRVDGGNIHFIVLQGCGLAEKGYLNNDNSKPAWSICQRRTWCNEVYYNAIPEVERAWYKKMIVTSSYNASNMVDTEDWFAIPTETEFLGHTKYSIGIESNKTTQFTYYEDVEHRKIKSGILGSVSEVWTRSMSYSVNYPYRFCYITGIGESNYSNMMENRALVPFGCI